MANVRLLYRSDSELTGADRAVRDTAFAIADRAAKRNVLDDVTGALMFVNGVFVQVLEGEATVVEGIFERICRDMRHRRIVVLDHAITDERIFSEWSMVAFEGDQRARALFPAMSEATSFARRNPLSAKMAVEAMRALLYKRERQMRQTGADQMIGTDIGGQSAL
jgi:hypothetical protein